MLVRGNKTSCISIFCTKRELLLINIFHEQEDLLTAFFYQRVDLLINNLDEQVGLLLGVLIVMSTEKVIFIIGIRNKGEKT